MVCGARRRRVRVRPAGDDGPGRRCEPRSSGVVQLYRDQRAEGVGAGFLPARGRGRRESRAPGARQAQPEEAQRKTSSISPSTARSTRACRKASAARSVMTSRTLLPQATLASTIGRTPLLRLRRLVPGRPDRGDPPPRRSSRIRRFVRTRAARAILEEGEARGRLRPGSNHPRRDFGQHRHRLRDDRRRARIPPQAVRARDVTPEGCGSSAPTAPTSC